MCLRSHKSPRVWHLQSTLGTRKYFQLTYFMAEDGYSRCCWQLLAQSVYLVCSTSLTLLKPWPISYNRTQLDIWRFKPKIKYVSTHWNEVFWVLLCRNQREDRSAGSHVQLFSLLGTWKERKVTVVIPWLEGYCIVNISVLPVISQWDTSFKMEHRHNLFCAFFSFVALQLLCLSVDWASRTNTTAPRKSRSYSMRFMFVLLGQTGRSAEWNEETLISCNSNFET